MTRSRFVRSVSWAPSISLSWMWGLGFFYSIHIVWIQGWTGFAVFALANACGLAMFGVALTMSGRDVDGIFSRIAPRFASLFLLCQVAAVAITLFSITTYCWPLLLPDSDRSVHLVLTALLAAFGCAVAHGIGLQRLRTLHFGYLAVAAACIALIWASMPAIESSREVVDVPTTLSLWTFLLPTIVGFALGPWGDLQQWQRAVEISRSGLSPAVAYAGGGLIFLALLVANASLSYLAGPYVVTAADGAIGAQGSVAARLAADGAGFAAIAFAVWAAIAAITTVDSFYIATRWYLSLRLANSLHPALAFVPSGLVASPLWLLGVSVAAASTMSLFGLSQTAYIMPYATLLVGISICIVAESVRGPTSLDAASCYLWGIVAALVFFVGYSGDLPYLVPLSTVVATAGPFLPVRFAIWPAAAIAPRPSVAVEFEPQEASAAAGQADHVVRDTPSVSHAKTIRSANENPRPAHGFDGQWFVMHVMPTYDDTNSVGNVYFANYIRWVGKARELFFNACMPNFDLETTRYLVLTKSFQHDFRRETAEFDPVIVRVSIARHNRKFVTLRHELVSDREGLLGRGEQDLMFVDRETLKPLDIPVDIVRGFLPFWPSRQDSRAGDEASKQVRDIV